ncbi:MAG: hypothetical protein LBD48_08025 [Treponema sp.]|nr:hypothetical protein [Treponema sp.]
MKRLVSFFVCVIFFAAQCPAQDKKNRSFNIVPMLNYELVSLENQHYHVPGGGLIFLKGEQNPPLSVDPDNVMIGLLYKSYIVEMPRLNLYHDIDFIAERKIGRHFFQVIASANSDKPVYGGLQTIYSSVGYGYALLRNETMHLTLGAALGAGDFDIELSKGIMLPVLPSPIISFGFNSPAIKLTFDWPKFSAAIAPESRIRMTVSIPVEFYRYRDMHDIMFESILWYRFFPRDFPYGDFAGIGLGIQNSGMDFALGEKGKVYDMNHYSVFGILDASFFKLSGGFIFYSRERYDAVSGSTTGNGFFIQAALLYQF